MSELLLKVALRLLNPEDCDRITMEFEGLPPNPNEKSKKHWTKNAESNKLWRTTAREAGEKAQARVVGAMALIHYHVSLGDGRRHDYDNVLAGFKPVQDGLVDAGMLPDDTFEDVIPIITFDREKPRRFTITVYSLD